MSMYMINICYGENTDPSKSVDNNFIMEEYQKWSDKIRDLTVSAHKLKDNEGRRLVKKNGDICDGPYVESKESIGGYYIIEAKDYPAAVDIAKACPSLLHGGAIVDVREVEF